MKWTILGGMLIAVGICTIPASQASAFELWGKKHNGCATCGAATSDCDQCASPCKSRCGKCGLFGRCRNRCGSCRSACGSCKSRCGSRCKLFGHRRCGSCSSCGSCGSSCGCGGGGLFGRLFGKGCGCKSSCDTGCATCGGATIVPAPPAEGDAAPPEPAPMDEEPQASRTSPSYSSQSLPYRIIRNNR